MHKKVLSMLLVNTLLQAYTSEDLEKRIASLEKTLDSQKQTKMQTALNGGNNSFNQQSFMPDISLILSGSAVTRNIDNDRYEGYSIDGFIDKTGEIPFNKNRGFNLNYAELGMHAAVGPYFDSDAIFHLSPDGFEIEEAYISTKKLPANFDIKAGKFRSAFGRINAMHQHAQHFAQTPLVYEAMLGLEGINDAGIALHWVAPTDTYLMTGIEALQGVNEESFGKSSSNTLYIGYLKSGFDIGDNTSVLAGINIASGKTPTNKNSTLYGGELTVKYIIDSYSSLNWQSEYLYRDKDDVKQSGYYTQLLYAPNSNWEMGMRYNALNKNARQQPNDLKRYAAIATYKPFEFSKFRLQMSHDTSKSFDGIRKNENQVILEFLVETGAHGAHAF
ncbi:MAG: hypothetical protein DSZ08_07190 [Sulfurovum sp.]|nr:MAG: hypothetical protein DSZ08_07190 [Sulfurovum sp.]